MAKVVVRDAESRRPANPQALVRGGATCSAYFDGRHDPLHLHLIELEQTDSITLAAGGVDLACYVWMGCVEIHHIELTAGSSFIVERGGTAELTGAGTGATILLLAAATASAEDLPAGLHLLPAADAPRSDNLGGSAGVGGVMHADSDCPTCSVWLHENLFGALPSARHDEEAGVHAHSEDEIIFVTGGEMKLGSKLYGPGTALAIAANTLYSFGPGPSGLSFLNFRAHPPGEIRFANGTSISETEYWRERLPRPQYRSGRK